jgi:hypothetical protein
MFVRSLLAVLTLLGAVPLRICTCGAAHVHHAPPPILPSEPPPLTPAVSPDDDQPAHAHDCGVHKPRPAMSLAVPVSFADTPADVAVAALTPELPPVVVGIFTADTEPRSPDPPTKPLFLALCTLRN